MLCEACRIDAPKKAGDGDPALSAAPRADRLAGIICDSCGVLLPPRDATDLYLRRLTRLASFGLVGGSGPILKP